MNVLITVVVVTVTVLLGAEGGHLCAAASQVFVVHLSDVVLTCAGGIAARGFHRLVVVLHHHLLVVLRVVRVLHHHRLAHSQPWHQALPFLFLLFLLLPPFRIWVRKRLHAANCTFLFHFGSVLRRQAGPATRFSGRRQTRVIVRHPGGIAFVGQSTGAEIQLRDPGSGADPAFLIVIAGDVQNTVPAGAHGRG